MIFLLLEIFYYTCKYVFVIRFDIGKQIEWFMEAGVVLCYVLFKYCIILYILGMAHAEVCVMYDGMRSSYVLLV